MIMRCILYIQKWIICVSVMLIFTNAMFAQTLQNNSSSIGDRESLLKIENFSPSKGKWSISSGLSYRSVDRGGYIPSFFRNRLDQANLSFGACYA